MGSKVKVQHDKTKLFGFERLYFYKVKNLDFTLVKSAINQWYKKGK